MSLQNEQLATSVDPDSRRRRQRAPAAFRTLDAHDLGELLRKTASSVQADLSRAPHRLPPPIRIEGGGCALWLESRVLAWLQEREVKVSASPQRGRPTKRQQIERAQAQFAQQSNGSAA